MASLAQQLLRRKPVTEMSAETGLSMFGVGATIGTGIFFVLGQAVELAGHGARGGRGDLHLQCDPGRHLRPDPDPVRDGPRRDDARDLPQGEPAHPHAGSQHASSHGSFGHVALGSVTDRVVHSSPVTMARAANEAVAAAEGLDSSPPVEAVIGHGASCADAIDDIGWGPGDVLVVGSSELGPVAQVFLGSRATKILRHSPVPVFVVPRSRSEELAHARD